jgi:hypothetical protein
LKKAVEHEEENRGFDFCGYKWGRYVQWKTLYGRRAVPALVFLPLCRSSYSAAFTADGPIVDEVNQSGLKTEKMPSG